MSANHDKSQKITFVYSNLYQLVRKQSEAESIQAPLDAHLKPLATSTVLKATQAPVAQIQNYHPAHFLSKRIEVPKPEVVLKAQNQALNQLKGNLQSLGTLHNRLKVMLQELEELVKEDDKK